jgi:hypothetical protein
MTTFVSQKTQTILKQIDSMVPETADPEINFALKCYYLGKEHTEDEIIEIMTRRVKEIEELKAAMTITSFEELDRPVEETKSPEITNGEANTSERTNDKGHEDNQSIN